MRRKILLFLSATLFAIMVSNAAYAKTSLSPVFSHGLKFQSADKAFKIGVGGRIMNDWAWLSADDALKDEETAWDSGTEFRRARLYIGGHIYENVKFKAQFDFAGGKAKAKDLYIALTKIPGIGMIKTGRFKQPFGLEELTSSKYITFMERSMAMEAFAPSRQSGIMIGSTAWDKRVTWHISTFKITNGYGKQYGDSDMSFAGRVTVAPYKEDKNIIHLGVSYAVLKPNGDSSRFEARPEMHLAPKRLADTKSISADNVNLLGLEAAAVFGPFSAQAEYVKADISALDGSDPGFSGYYAYVSYFITGESRHYKKGVFKRVSPNSNFGEGAGALEVALRFSNLDLNDAGISGNEVDTTTVGLNWHLNPNTRVMLNYVSADQKNIGKANGMMARFQVDF
ncbi:Phosphate-specific outer membrane porin OprP; Pyrophosphate-specific outer membrane porin OprO [hydrothermal vent metagenome]|uniref:Phosphate-specific outer membrane porin OprP Pyrophosphate-specific outer membrane porin OprO n=1 Tax=hydrothermal vent metagenome TaxID=652676 RepID=A0A3B1C1K9_9ZZZZ